ncbi:MAG TPA: protein kinase [Thermoanaerobaculia bacterium]
MLAPGTRLGPYTILELLGSGGMGEVYRAEDTRLHRDVAIKVLPAHLEGDATALERFRREARAVASLSHPNILSIFDFGSENGIHYAVTELLHGETLRTRMGRGLAPRDALELLLEICEGVAAAHASNIVHRDLKPENIFITDSGRVKVLDFGLARGSALTAPRSDDVTVELRPTEPGIVIGTLGYLAPEQIAGRGATPASDVFALGCILYEMICGRLPFERESSAASMVALMHDDAPRITKSGEPLLRDIDALVQQCLSKSPHERPQHAGELGAQIQSILDGVRPTVRMRAPRRTAKLAIIAALLLVIAATAGFFAWRARNRVIDNGYDLRVTDIRADGETRRLIELALHADAEGNRPKAIELLEEAERRGQRTAFPAAFLSSFSDAAGNAAASQSWARKALARLGGASTYESLLVRYLSSPRSDGTNELAKAKSALDVRPGAWRLRLAAAHIYLGQRDREAARRELQQIDIAEPDDRRLMFVLADRAALGDIAGAERDLRRSRLARRPVLAHYAEARITWSKGDARRASALYDRAAQEAENEGLGPVEAEAWQLSGVALLRLRQWDEAQRRFAKVLAVSREIGLANRVFESSALAAYAAHRSGDAEERDRRLRDAMAVGPPMMQQIALRLLAIRLGSDVWKQWNIDAVARDPRLRAELSLVRAREAFAAGDAATARRELARARAEGIDTAEVREEAELLASELGMPSQLLPPDPPYPNVLRYLAIFDQSLT